jgi:hypothetical protein
VATLNLSVAHCEHFRTAINLYLADPTNAAPIPGVAADNIASIERLTRLRDALEKAVTVGTFDPAIALAVLDRVEKNPSTEVVFTTTDSSHEIYDHAIRLQARDLIGGSRTRFSVHALGLKESGKVLRGFIRCWSSPVVAVL